MHENDISYAVRGAAYAVYNSLGPGLLESVYENTMAYELRNAGFEVKKQYPIPVYYNDLQMDHGFRADLFINSKVIVEIKSVDELNRVHFKQVMTYLRLSDCKLGILINFNVDDLNSGIKRIVNKL